MNKVISINLGGTAFQLEEGGYDALRKYLDDAAARLQHNPDRDEIISDIESAIAEKFRSFLAGHKTVVVTSEAAAVLEQMGPIQADPGSTGEPDASSRESTGRGESGKAEGEKETGQPSGTPRRLYRIDEGAMFAGVCNGLAAYANIDPTLVRLGFVVLTLLGGSGVLLYVVMAFVVPEACSAEEKASASGSPLTAQEFIRRAKEGYYEAAKHFPDRRARREWKRRFKREVRANACRWQYNWHGYWAGHAPVHPGMGFALPVLSLVHGVATILWICAFISMLATGTVLGLPLPGNVPVWVACLLLFMAYAILVSPLKTARRYFYSGMVQPKWSWSLMFFADAIVRVIVIVVLLSLAVHYSPELSKAVHSIPSLMHQTVDDIRTAWKTN